MKWRYDMVWFDMIWFYLYWFDMVLHVLFQYDMIWYELIWEIPLYIYHIYTPHVLDYVHHIMISLLLKLRSSAMKGHAELDHRLLLPFRLLLGHLDTTPDEVLLLVLVQVDARDLHCCSKPPKCFWPTGSDLSSCEIPEKLSVFCFEQAWVRLSEFKISLGSTENWRGSWEASKGHLWNIQSQVCWEAMLAVPRSPLVLLGLSHMLT